VILRCTKKLLDVMRLPLADPAPEPDPEDWYANLLWFDRRKCLLLTHSATLFTIFEADVPASGLRATREFVADLIGRELSCEGLSAGTFGDLERQEVLLARTVDRSVLGCMNDMAFRCEHVIAVAGGLARTDLAELNRSLRRNINSARGYSPPIELAAKRLAGLRRPIRHAPREWPRSPPLPRLPAKRAAPPPGAAATPRAGRWRRPPRPGGSPRTDGT
jgi:Domain of unknown function (DUF6933)